MKKELLVNVPLNGLSFGNVSVNLLREMWKRKMNVSIFPVGNAADLSTFDKLDPAFLQWIDFSIKNRLEGITGSTPSLKLWHLNGAENRITEKQHLFTFHEVNFATQVESSLAKLQTSAIFSSNFSQDIFKANGCKNTHSVKVGFDEDFSFLDKKFYEDKVVFGLSGKFEKRKHTAKIIKLWINKYGGDFKYRLHCLITNPFYKPEEMQAIVKDIIGDSEAGNVVFYTPQATNTLMNDWLNSIDIDLSGLSGGEGWNLGAFNSTCLGKWSIVLNHTSHKDWATEKNSILLEPSGMESAEDGKFFVNGNDFNQGNIFTFDDDEVIDAMTKSEKLSETPNTEGIQLGKELTYSKTLDSLLDIIN
jgi:hypothetical protein|tara:strand:- start:1845 stop:2930 length:1086 start_codon:yes stop_codon:yes gene_type:complete